jgi:uncharacterized lipoprotein NlpE involved in copper resistance
MSKMLLALCAVTMVTVLGCSSGSGGVASNGADAGAETGGPLVDGGGGGGAPAGHATKSDGTPFLNVVDAYSSAKSCQSAGCSGTTIFLTDTAGTCPGHADQRQHTIYIHLYNDPAKSAAPVTQPGTFTVWNAIAGVGKQPAADIATFYEEIAGESNPRPGFTGIVTVTAIDGDVYHGTFDVQDRDGQRIEGTFDPRGCTFTF